MLCDLVRSRAPALVLSSQVPQAWLDLLRPPSARERVGVLLGTSTRAESVIRLSNSSALPGCFRIEQREILRVSRHASRHGRSVIAFFHEHAGGNASLSHWDVLGLKASEWPWVIVSLDGGRLQYRAYAAPTGDALDIVCE